MNELVMLKKMYIEDSAKIDELMLNRRIIEKHFLKEVNSRLEMNVLIGGFTEENFEAHINGMTKKAKITNVEKSILCGRHYKEKETTFTFTLNSIKMFVSMRVYEDDILNVEIGDIGKVAMGLVMGDIRKTMWHTADNSVAIARKLDELAE